MRCFLPPAEAPVEEPRLLAVQPPPFDMELHGGQHSFMTAAPKDVVQELLRRLEAGDHSAIDELIAEDMVNHAAGPQGREGWKRINAIIANDLGGDRSIEHHQFIAEGDLVAHHMTMHGNHQASTMPLLAGVEVTNVDVAWTYIHIWRVANGQIVEHWACRDDVGLLRQVGAWPPK
jgi:lactoylglutathione lyase